MSSRAVYIANYAQALTDGTFPGSFDDKRLVYEFPPVISTNSRGSQLVWIIRVELTTGDKREDFDEMYLHPGAETPDGMIGVITTESYQVSADGVRGKTREGGKPTYVRTGKNLSKANATNVATQALRDALGRYNAQVKKKSTLAVPKQPPTVTSDPLAEQPPSPLAGQPPGPLAERPPSPLAEQPPGPLAEQPPPMLVKKIGETRDATLTPEVFAKGITVQRKFNGVRVVSYLYDGQTRLYSRTKGVYPGFVHIRAELKEPLAKAPEVPAELFRGCESDPQLDEDEISNLKAIYAADRVHLDGEIYLHGKSLRWISGQARREDDEATLNYFVFDCFFPAAKAAGHDMSSANRQKYLDLFFASAGGEMLTHIKRAENFRADSVAAIEALRDRFLEEGYEGAIARKDCAGYRYSFNNYHSANLVKIKPKFDSEFTVVGYTQGTRGKDVGAVIWICETNSPSAETFNVVPKDMTYEERYTIFRCLGEEVENDPDAIAAGGPTRLTRFERDFKGRPLTVEYPELSTKTGKPVQAKALTFRTYEDGGANDPLRRLYRECK